MVIFAGGGAAVPRRTLQELWKNRSLCITSPHKLKVLIYKYLVERWPTLLRWPLPFQVVVPAQNTGPAWYWPHQKQGGNPGIR
jgi:hypothetical protein